MIAAAGPKAPSAPSPTRPSWFLLQHFPVAASAPCYSGSPSWELASCPRQVGLWDDTGPESVYMCTCECVCGSGVKRRGCKVTLACLVCMRHVCAQSANFQPVPFMSVLERGRAGPCHLPHLGSCVLGVSSDISGILQTALLFLEPSETLFHSQQPFR